MTGENIESAFEKLVQTTLNRIENGDIEDGMYDAARKHVENISTDSLLRNKRDFESQSQQNAF